MRVLLLLTILFFKPNLISLDLYELDFKDDYLNSGRTLMNLEFGLHDLEPNSSSKNMIIHGGDSRGLKDLSAPEDR